MLPDDGQPEWTSIVIPLKIYSSTISFKSDKARKKRKVNVTGAGSQALGWVARFFVIS